MLESWNISSLVSHTHKITIDKISKKKKAESFADLANDGDNGESSVALAQLESGSMFLDRDFILDVETESDDKTNSPQARLHEHPTLENRKALMLTLPQKFLFEPQPLSQRTEILFLVDRSGSMSDKMESLKSAMRFFLKGIPEGRKF